MSNDLEAAQRTARIPSWRLQGVPVISKQGLLVSVAQRETIVPTNARARGISFPRTLSEPFFDFGSSTKVLGALPSGCIVYMVLSAVSNASQVDF